VEAGFLRNPVQKREKLKQYKKMADKQEKRLQELQFLEQNLQNILLQKQAFQLELSETDSALAEIKDSKGDVYKVIGDLMIKTEKAKIQEDLSKKKELLGLRVKALDNQESSLTEKTSSIRDELTSSDKK